MLRQYFHQPQVEILYSAKGKPFLREGPFFNISHSHEKIVLLVSWEQSVGVDLEYIKPQRHFLKIAQRFFSAEDLLYMGDSLPRFYELWTQKEAFVKLHGRHIFDSEFRAHKEAYYVPLIMPGYVGHACFLRPQNQELVNQPISLHAYHEYEMSEF